MASYDGDIKLAVTLDSRTAEASMGDLKRSIAASLSEASTTRFDKGLSNVNKTVRETQQEFRKVQSEIQKAEDKMRELQTKQSVIFERGVVNQSKTATNLYDGLYFNKSDYSNLKLLDTQLENTGTRLDDLNTRADKLSTILGSTEFNPAATEGLKETAIDADKANDGISSINDRLREMQASGRTSTKVLTDGLNNVNNSVNKLGRRLTNMVKRVFVFSVITKVLRSLRTMLSSVAKSDTEFAKSLNQIKSNLWTSFAAIYTRALPALNALMSALVKVTGYITAFMSAITGTSVTDAYNTANELYQQTNQEDLQKQKKATLDKEIKGIQDKIKALQKENKTIEENEKAQEEANKKTLLSFDELNQLSSPKTENAQIAENEKIIEQLEEQLEKLTDEKNALEEAALAANALSQNLTYPKVADTISKEITEIIQNLVLVIEGAMLVIGVILLFTGNVPLGLAVIIGALIAMNYTLQSFEFSDQGIEDIVTQLWEALIAAELVIGAILVFSGANVPLGIGIIIAAMIQQYALYQVAWDEVSQNVKNVITALSVASAVVLIALGMVMIFSGAAIAAGIALVIAGLAIGISGVALNWDEVSTNVTTQVQIIQALIGGALIAIGAILIFTGIAIPAGIALIIGGLAPVTDAVIDWNTIPDNIRNIISNIAGIVAGAMLVLGVILLFTGNIGTGIALIIAGISVAVALFDWSTVPDSVRDNINTIAAIVSISMLAIGVVLLLTGNIAPGIGLILAGGGLALGVVDWSKVPNETRTAISTLLAVVGGASFVIGVALLFMGQIPIGLGLTVAGAAAMVGAIAAAPEALRQQIQNEISFYMQLLGGALLVIGAILCFTGVMIPEGIAMMGAGAISLIGGIAIGQMNPNALGDMLGSSLNNVNTTVAKGVAKTDAIVDDSMKSLSKSVTEQSKTIVNDMNGISKRLSQLDGSVATITIKENYISSQVASTGVTALPHLAQGAVIPPNREFMAVLGDQKSGTNIEAPLATIKQAVAEVLNEGGIGGGENINIKFTGNLAQLARILKPEISRESVRAGSSVITGGNRI